MNDNRMENKNKSKKSRKHIIIPICIAIYFAVIAYLNKDEWLVENNTISYWGKIVVEVLVLIVLSIVIKKRDDYRRKRNED